MRALASRRCKRWVKYGAMPVEIYKAMPFVARLGMGEATEEYANELRKVPEEHWREVEYMPLHKDRDIIDLSSFRWIGKSETVHT